MSPSTLPLVTMILVGGLGKRLWPVVSDGPKPLAMVGETAFLEILIDSLAGKGVRDLVLLTGYKGGMIEHHLRDGYREGVGIRFSSEETPLETGGAVRNAAEFATDPSMVIYGDTFFDADSLKLFEYHFHKGGDATLSLVKVNDTRRYGSVSLDEDGRITGFTEKGVGSGGPGLISGGLYMLSKNFILGLPPGRKFSMEREVFPSLARSGRMFGLQQERPFFDIGTPESYEAFREFMRNRPEPWKTCAAERQHRRIPGPMIV